MSAATSSPSVDRVQAGKINQRYQKYWLTEPNQYISHRISPSTLATRQAVVTVEMKVLKVDSQGGKLVVGFGRDRAMRLTEVGAITFSPTGIDTEWQTVKLPIAISHTLDLEGWHIGVRNESFKGTVLIRHLDVKPLLNVPSTQVGMTPKTASKRPTSLQPVRVDIEPLSLPALELVDGATLDGGLITLDAEYAKARTTLPKAWSRTGPIQLDIALSLSAAKRGSGNMPHVRLHRGDHWTSGRLVTRRVAAKAASLTDTMVSVIIDSHHWASKESLQLIVDQNGSAGKTLIKSIKPRIVYDADVTYGVWTGRGNNNRWDNPENWSGRRIPRATDAVVLSDRSGKSCDIDGKLITVGSLTIESGYSGRVVGAGRIVITRGNLIVERGQGNVLSSTAIEFSGAAHQRIICEADLTLASLRANKTAGRLSTSGRKLSAGVVRLAHGSAVSLYNESFSASQLRPLNDGDTGVVASIEGIAHRVDQPIAIGLVNPGLALRVDHVDKQLARLVNQRAVPQLAASHGKPQPPVASANVSEMGHSGDSALSGLSELAVVQERTRVEEAFLSGAGIISDPSETPEPPATTEPKSPLRRDDVAPAPSSQMYTYTHTHRDQPHELSRREARRLGHRLTPEATVVASRNITAKRSMWRTLGQWLGLNQNSVKTNTAHHEVVADTMTEVSTSGHAPSQSPIYNFVTSANQNETVSHHTERDFEEKSRRARRKGGI